MDFSALVNFQLMSFILLAVGAYFRKKGVLNAVSTKTLTDLLIMVFLPCSIFTSFNKELDADFIKISIMLIFVSSIAHIGCLILSHFIYNWVPEDKRTILKSGTIISNSGIMGTNICGGVFGADGLLYSSMAVLPIRIIMWTFGITIFLKNSKTNLLKNVITHPCIIAMVLGLIRMGFHISLPVFVQDAVGYLGSCNTAVAVLAIGSILCEVDFKTIFNKYIAFYVSIRLIIIPLTALIILKLLHIDYLTTGIVVLLLGMPTATTTVILSEKYGYDALFASKCVVVTTVLSLITIPMFGLLI